MGGGGNSEDFNHEAEEGWLKQQQQQQQKKRVGGGLTAAQLEAREMQEREKQVEVALCVGSCHSQRDKVVFFF
jgi:hypothetical protein